MCAVPVAGLHKGDLSLKQLREIQGRIKTHIPTGAPLGCCWLYVQAQLCRLVPASEVASEEPWPCSAQDRLPATAQATPTTAAMSTCWCCHAGFNWHKHPLPGARQTLDEISHAKPPSRFLEEAQDAKRAVQQLGTLGGGNHFLGALRVRHDSRANACVLCVSAAAATRSRAPRAASFLHSQDACGGSSGETCKPACRPPPDRRCACRGGVRR